MSRRRAGIALGMLVLLIAAVLSAWSSRPDPLAARPPAERPGLLLLTSLPLFFGEGFTLGGGGSPALTRLRERYRVEPIALADAGSLAGHRLLLMAHPRAQTAEALVELDAWVRGGGRVLLLADPLLEWDSARPLGDPLRPPPGFADTGLLAHWGLRLTPPARRGTVAEVVDGHLVRFDSPGTVDGSRFALAADRRIARGAIGKGRVTVVADADWLADKDNLDLLVAELARLER
ncbi:MAG: DUF4350 domain-containing protein [Sphingomicrobium sp.]